MSGLSENDSSSRITQLVEASSKTASADEPIRVPLARVRGQAIGRYLVLQQLGHGGMGVVYESYDPELDRKVAVKVVAVATSGAAREGRRTRLLREAQAMARVSHPNVVSVFDVGETEDGVFLAMELVDGVTLRAWLEERKREPKEIIRACRDAASALVAAHAAGLVHRDFKPENVLVGRNGRVMVTDFGLARLADWASSEPLPMSSVAGSASKTWSDDVTRPGAVLGTPYYMAPELFRGTTADERTDQFAFCAALYWALYRQRAFDPDDLRKAAASGTPPPPMRPLPAEPRIPTPVRRVLERGLATDPAARHGAMSEVQAELQRALQTGRRSRVVVAATSLVAIAAVAGAIGGTQWTARAAQCSGGASQMAGAWGDDVRARLGTRLAAVGEAGPTTFDRTVAALDAYSAKWLAMHRDACEATAVRHEQSESALQLRMQCLDARLRELQSVTALLTEADTAMASRAVDAVLGLASVRQCADIAALSEVARLPLELSARAGAELLAGDLARINALRLAGDYRTALEQATSAVERASGIGYRPLYAQALYHRGILEEAVGRGADAAQTLAMAANAAEVARDDRLKVRIAAWLVYAASQSGRPADGHFWERAGKAALERSGRDPELESELLSNLGALLVWEGRLAEALEADRQSLALVKAALGPDSSRAILTLGNLAYVELTLGQRETAVEHLRTSIAGIEKLRGPNHPMLTAPLNTLAKALSELGEFAPAHGAIERALFISEARFGPTHVRTTDALDTKGLVLRREGRFEEALAVYRESMERKLKTFPAEDPELSYSHDGIGQSLIGAGRVGDAIPELQQALKLRAPAPLTRATTRFALAKALGAPKRAEAARLCDEARAEFAEGGRPDKAREVSQWLAAQPP